MNGLAQYTALKNLEDFKRGQSINQFEDQVYGNRDYDYAVAGILGKLANDRSGNVHGSDVGKLPNHPTFSDQSIYSSDKHPGGVWREEDGKVSYTPSLNMVQSGNMPGLAEYMSRFEPGVQLRAPIPVSKKVYEKSSNR